MYYFRCSSLEKSNNIRMLLGQTLEKWQISARPAAALGVTL
jgi:hypothetical protein